MKIQKYIKPLIFIAGCLAIGFLSSWFAGESIVVTYLSLTRPVFAPPSWIFAPVWTILYIMMGISLYFVWEKRKEHKINTALTLFFVQLFLNFLWTIIFFRWNNLSLAFYEIFILLLTIVFTIFYFKKISKMAAYLLVPYALWVFFATILTFSIFYLN
ncbi:MAG: tryptophan-rich sensory protein [Candidatus Pacebacteria bacterium]|nr:tryptophan-rich sensory protein [Candidatus Paceibacterota bacterium]